MWPLKRSSRNSIPIVCRRSSIGRRVARSSREASLLGACRDKFNDMVSDADASFRDLFGEEFAKAYEQQLERLKARERGQTP